MTAMLRRREPSPRGADAFYGWGVWRGGFYCSTPGRGARRGARAQRPDVVPETVPETGGDTGWCPKKKGVVPEKS